MSSERKELEEIIVLVNDLEKLGEISPAAKIVINQLIKLSNRLIREVEGLREENTEIKKRLEQLEYGRKSSENSSLPPALDPNRKRGRKATKNTLGGKKKNIGGQLGHKGSTLKKVRTPDKVIYYPLRGKCNCGVALSKIESTFEERQVFEVELKRKAVSHRVGKGICSCGVKHSAKFPADVKAPVQYGSSVQALSSYFSQYQLIPYERVEEIFKDLFNFSLSKGTVNNHINKISIPLRDYTMWAKESLLNSKLNFADETTTQIGKERFHLHTVSSDQTTLLEVHKSRGKEAVKSMGVLPKYRGKLVHDCYAMYFGYPCEDVVCNAHLQRELDYFCTIEKYDWAYRMKIFLYSLFLEVKDLKRIGKKKRYHKDFYLIKKEYRKYLREAKKEMNELINKKGKKQEKVVSLYFRLKKYEAEILSFAKDYSIPFTNNQAERDLRMSKVHLKISGCFRSEQMARNWSLMRSFISTLKKREINIFDSIKLLTDPYQKKPIYSILGPPT